MKKGWEYIDFKDVFPVKMGKTPPRGDKSSWDENKETHNKWVSIADISNNEGKIIKDTKEYISDSAAEKINKVSKGSLLMSFKLSIGRMAFAGDDLYTNEAIIAIPESNKYILRFIYYYLLSYNWLSLTEGNEKVKGATLNKSSIGKIQLPVLLNSEQQRIVDYLDSAFAKIDAMKANAEKALNEAKALFQASLKEMLEPKEGWEEKKLKEVVASITDGDHQPPPKSDDGIPFITISNIDKNSNKIVFGETFYVPQRYYCALKKDRIPQQGDVLYTVTGSFGIPVLIDFQKDFCFQRHIALIRPKIGVLSPTYLFYWILSSYATSQAENTATGAAQRTVSLNSLRNFTIHIPTFSTQQSIVETLDSLKSKVDRLQENYDKISQECDALKQAILRKVFE